MSVVNMDAQGNGEQFKLTVDVPLSVNDIISMQSLNQTIWYIYDMYSIYTFATLSHSVYFAKSLFIYIYVCMYVYTIPKADSLLFPG